MSETTRVLWELGLITDADIAEARRWGLEVNLDGAEQVLDLPPEEVVSRLEAVLERSKDAPIRVTDPTLHKRFEHAQRGRIVVMPDDKPRHSFSAFWIPNGFLQIVVRASGLTEEELAELVECDSYVEFQEPHAQLGKRATITSGALRYLGDEGEFATLTLKKRAVRGDDVEGN